MANADTPYGLKPWGPLLSAKRYNVNGGDNAPVFINDVVATTADGYVSAAAAGATNIIGVSVTFLTGGTTDTVMVANDPDQLLEGQQDGTATQTMVGTTTDHVAGTGSLVTKLSGHEVDTTVSVGASGFTIHEYVQAPDQAIGANSRTIVSHTTEHVRRVATGF